MGKKCIPGIICIENMTLFILIVILGIVIYLYYAVHVKSNQNSSIYDILPTQSTIIQTPIIGQVNTSQFTDPLTNLYAPPLKNDGMYFRNDIPTSSILVTSNDIRGQPNQAVPINIQTRGFSASYSQIGILTRSNGGEMILPLMGKRIMNGRNKLQYYTISNTGNINTKLPISINGRSCSGEYGCDEINNGDTVYVEGYNDTFRSTIYENGLFSYIPVL